MSISTFIYLYLISVPIFFLIDMVWLGLIARDFYQAQLKDLLGDVNWTAAIIFYLIFLVGLTFFATYPAVSKNSFLIALGLGALYGFFTYATYDLTNLATLKGWPLKIVLVDIVWGTFLGASVSAISALIYLKIL